MRAKTSLHIFLIAAMIACASFADDKASKEGATWSAEVTAAVVGFKVPECVLFNKADEMVYVSNVESAPEAYWKDDAKGHISLLDADGGVVDQRWVDSAPEMVLHGPKGMCVLGDTLYFTDNTRLMSCVAKTGGEVRIVAEGFKQANDLATDGTSVWVSDTLAGRVFAVSPDGERREIPSPKSVNGLAFHGDKLFCVSWDLHEVYELDPSGKAAPVSFGLAKHFTNLDGIEVLDDGTIIVSDFMGNQICTVSPDRKTVEKLIDIESPADIGLDRERGLLGVPQFMKDTVVFLKLKKQ